MVEHPVLPQVNAVNQTIYLQHMHMNYCEKLIIFNNIQQRFLLQFVLELLRDALLWTNISGEEIHLSPRAGRLFWHLSLSFNVFSAITAALNPGFYENDNRKLNVENTETERSYRAAGRSDLLSTMISDGV